MNFDRRDELTGKIIGCAMHVHRTLSPGFLEKVYSNALCIELAELGIDFETEKRLTVFYREKPIGSYSADIIIHDSLILELKAVEALHANHEVQLVNHLTATRIDIGLLLNFGERSLHYKKKFRITKPQEL